VGWMQLWIIWLNKTEKRICTYLHYPFLFVFIRKFKC
jgi:hypothetical protein